MAARKLTAFIQIIGLGIGLGGVILMLAYILHEYSFDKYHTNSSHIYRVVYDKNCTTPYPMGDRFKEEIPGVKNIFRIYNLWNAQIKKNDDYLKEEHFILADSSIFSILDIPILAGNQKLLFNDRSDIVISEKAAEKYFGTFNPVGKLLEINMSGELVKCNITGVYKNFPSNSSLQPEFIGNIKLAFHAFRNSILLFGNIKEINEQELPNSWDEFGMQTFVLTSDNSSISAIERKGTAICKSHLKEKKEKEIHLQEFTKMYFYSEDLWNKNPLLTSNVKSIRLFEGIAILILLIACFNYILLTTTETQSQLKEIACRKVNGASTRQIAHKIYTYALLVAILSLLPAMLFVKLTIPFFNQLFEKNIDIGLFLNPLYVIATIGITIFTGFLGGSYTILHTRKLSPANLFRPIGVYGFAKLFSSGGIIVFQFIVFILLVSSAIIMDKQVRYSETQNQGFNSDNVLVFKLSNLELRKKAAVIKSKLVANSHVLGVATSGFTPPGDGFFNMTLGKEGAEVIKEEGMFVGNGLIELLKIPVLDGTSFTENCVQSDGILINAMAANKYKVKVGDVLGSFKVRCILKDFHVHSFHRPINPLVILKMDDKDCFELAVRTDGYNVEVIREAKKIWEDILPTAFFEYQLLNDRISSFYAKERTQVKTITFFSLLAVFLAVIGLLGYVSIITLKRTKEIGIRKVNGARITEILAMLNKDFVKWVAIAFIIACPIAWFAMYKWLQNFAYKTELSWWVFTIAGLMALIVALITVSGQSWRAAIKNPVEALRYE
jgi:putative ABC transport system permease protein